MSPLPAPYDPRLNKPFMMPILRIDRESLKVKSFTVDYNPIETPISILPGQFVMVWIPGIDEIPMSVSRIGPKFRIRISVAAVGEATKALHALKVGDLIGIRGPYGTSYSVRKGTTIILGGGIGMASVMPLIHQFLAKPPDEHSKIIIIEGARSKEELLFTDEITQHIITSSEAHYCTDDGTCGFKGFVTEKLDELLQFEMNTAAKKDFPAPITVYACGPEKMLVNVVKVCQKHKLSAQLSLERMMRCGFGICGLCALEPTGLLVCRDGPVFTLEQLANVTDFGKYHRDFSGKPIPL
jgi:dihydroorotate dehydrogenase electron transfer subunit